MNFRYLLLVPVIALAACDGSDSSAPPAPVVQTSDTTFADAANAQLAALNDKVTSLSTKLADSQTRLDQLNGRIGSTDAGIGPVTAKIDALVAQVKGLGETANTASEIISRLSGDGTKEKPGEIAKAADDVARLIGDKAEPATIAAAQKRLEDLKDKLASAATDLSNAQDQLALLSGEGTSEKPGIAKLAALLSALDSKDDSGAIQKAGTKLTKLTEDANTLTGILTAAEATLKRLNGEGGEIAVTQARLKTLEGSIATAKTELAALEGDGTQENPGKIAKARDEIARLTGAIDRLTETLRLQTARALALDLKAQDKFAEAALAFKDAGMVPDAADMFKAAGMREEAADMYTRAGMDEEAYKVYAPADYVVQDKIKYDDSKSASLDPKDVDEKPAVKRHKMTLNGKTFWFTASTGHLIAYAPKDKKDAQASIFYTAYTRDDLPKDNRPVTFVFNGGPGSSSVWLHMGAWGPQRIEMNSPAVAPDAAEKQPEDLPLADNTESLLDETDLVFIDPPGTGYSQAIAPHVNKDFWGVQVDADVLFQNIKHYVNLNQRQSSPKYLYGESYGGGIRAPILSRMMVEAGTGAYDPDPSGKKTIALSGSVFHSPVFDMGSMCQQCAGPACWTLFPTYAMTHKAYAAADTGAKMDIAPSYLDDLRKFTLEGHLPVVRQFVLSIASLLFKPAWDTYAESSEGLAHFESAEDYTGVAAAAWKRLMIMPFSIVPARFFKSTEFYGSFMESFKPGYRLNIYDSRMYVKGGEEWGFDTYKPYDFNFYEHKAFHNVFARYLTEYLNYTNGSYYQQLRLGVDGINGQWIWKNGTTERTTTTTLPDITTALAADPSVKYLAVHGYYDAVTPFYTTEWNLGKSGLKARIPVKNYHGGHMIYYSDDARVALKKDVADFYKAPPVAIAPPVGATGAPATPRAAAVPALTLH
ncbi:S10 family serine carboxypeptidase-like protein [Phyllobacterium sp. P5_D12]